MTDLVARETFEESPHIKGEVRLTMLPLTRQLTESHVPLWSAFVFLNDHDKSILEFSSDSLGTDTKVIIMYMYSLILKFIGFKADLTLVQRYAHKCQQRIKELEWQNKEKDEMLDEVQGDYRRVLKENEVSIQYSS